MQREITKDVTRTETIIISEYDARRCSRDCIYCHKSMGNYRCYRNSGQLVGGYEEIEGFVGFDDIDNKQYKTADTYGFKRTDDCIKIFSPELLEAK